MCGAATTDRLKTDHRDAIKLVTDSRAETLTPIRILTEEEESFRDLIRFREVKDHMQVRHPIKSSLLWRGIRCDRTLKTWSAAYVSWLRTPCPFPSPHNEVWEELLRS